MSVLREALKRKEEMTTGVASREPIAHGTPHGKPHGTPQAALPWVLVVLLVVMLLIVAVGVTAYVLPRKQSLDAVVVDGAAGTAPLVATTSALVRDVSSPVSDVRSLDESLCTEESSDAPVVEEVLSEEEPVVCATAAPPVEVGAVTEAVAPLLSVPETNSVVTEPSAPVAPPVAVEPERDPNQWPELELEGVALFGGVGTVMINGEMLELNESIDGARVVAIEAKTATLEFNGETRTFRVRSSSRR